MTFAEIQEKDSQYILNTYARNPIAIDHGKGATLYGVDGKKYIDFTSGIGVNSLGYGNETWVQAITAQAQKLAHISNLYYTEPAPRLAEKLCKRTGLAGVFFANSGAEANEGMLKVARKYSSDRYGEGRGTVITLRNSFHGRTMNTLMATGQDHFHKHFYPFPTGYRYAPANDLAALEQAAGDDVCAVMMELVQGEGGVNPLQADYVRQVADLCRERDWLLLIDEVQTGIGRTGTLFAWQQFGIEPDVVSFAKGIASGLPFGGFLVNAKCRGVLTPGDHGSTFGANPIAAAAGNVVLDTLTDEFLEAVKQKGQYLREKIEAMDSPYTNGVRGLGMMLGVGVQGMTHKELCAKLRDAGLLCLTAGGDTLRLLPPLVITKEEMDEGLAIMAQVMKGA